MDRFGGSVSSSMKRLRTGPQSEASRPMEMYSSPHSPSPPSPEWQKSDSQRGGRFKFSPSVVLHLFRVSLTPQNSPRCEPYCTLTTKCELFQAWMANSFLIFQSVFWPAFPYSFHKAGDLPNSMSSLFLPFQSRIPPPAFRDRVGITR